MVRVVSVDQKVLVTPLGTKITKKSLVRKRKIQARLLTRPMIHCILRTTTLGSINQEIEPNVIELVINLEVDYGRGY